jgi:hypothetical protein
MGLIEMRGLSKRIAKRLKRPWRMFWMSKMAKM